MVSRLFGIFKRGDEAEWRPAGYRITATEAGANVNYDCYCGCDAGFALDRSTAEQSPEHCCCGNQMLVGTRAQQRLQDTLDDAKAYRVDTQSVVMPWGEEMDAALAIPTDEG